MEFQLFDQFKRGEEEEEEKNSIKIRRNATPQNDIQHNDT
jgi:hypothetical protein